MHSNQIDYRELLALYRITEDDLRLIQGFGVHAMARMDELVERWYAWLEVLPDYKDFFSDPETLARVQKLQDGYWDLFMRAAVDDEYVSRRVLVGEAHARIGLSLNTDATEEDLFAVTPKDSLEARPYTALAQAMAHDVQREPFTPLCDRLWFCDYECIEGPGSYRLVLERLERLTAHGMLMEGIEDHVDPEARDLHPRRTLFQNPLSAVSLERETPGIRGVSTRRSVGE